MRGFSLSLVLAAFCTTFVFADTGPVSAAQRRSVHIGRATGAAIAGGIVGLAVVTALSRSDRYQPDVYVPGYQPLYPPGGYPYAWQQSFSPKPGVNCYPVQRACYDVGGAYNPKWTARTFMLQ